MAIRLEDYETAIPVAMCECREPYFALFYREDDPSAMWVERIVAWAVVAAAAEGGRGHVIPAGVPMGYEPDLEELAPIGTDARNCLGVFHRDELPEELRRPPTFTRDDLERMARERTEKRATPTG